jgi:hypothetical protein
VLWLGSSQVVFALFTPVRVPLVGYKPSLCINHNRLPPSSGATDTFLILNLVDLSSDDDVEGAI